MKPQIYIVNNGIDFEKAVRSMVEVYGFKCELTPEGGDQGVDVIAHVGSRKIAIQCKFYSDNQVGNDAVQQVHAGRCFWDCDDSVVVANTGFTKSARELAAKTNVRLMHYSGLDWFLSQCKQRIKDDMVRYLIAETWGFQNIKRAEVLKRPILGCDFVLEAGDKSVSVFAQPRENGIVRAVQSAKAAATVLSCSEAWVVCRKMPIHAVTSYATKIGVSILDEKEYGSALQELDLFGENYGGMPIPAAKAVESKHADSPTPKTESSKIIEQNSRKQQSSHPHLCHIGILRLSYDVATSPKGRQKVLDEATDYVLKQMKYNNSLRARHNKLWQVLFFVGEFQDKLITPSSLTKIFGEKTRLACGLSRAHITPYRQSTQAIAPQKLWDIINAVACYLDASTSRRCWI